MKKQLIIIVSILILVLALASCNNTDKAEPTEAPAQNQGSDATVNDITGIDGRIIEIVDGVSITIRNEEDTSIYFKIDISGGLKFADGVNENLNPDNVIKADVNMINSESLPKETMLVTITDNIAPSYRIISSAEAKEIIDKGGALVIDVRTREEYENGYIPDAYNVPLDQIEKGIGNVAASKDDIILVYCRSGNRSKVAARILTEMGYTNVYDFGGIVDWTYGTIEP